MSAQPNPSRTFESFVEDLANWATNWAENESSGDKLVIDLLDLVPLFQGLGFSCDGLSDSENIKSNYNEVQIAVQCRHSGHKIVLVKPLTPAECKCEILGDAFWKKGDLTTAVYETTEKGILPTVPDEFSEFLKFVVNKLLTMLRSSKPALDEPKAAPKTLLFKNMKM